jgi:hypothetical protein
MAHLPYLRPILRAGSPLAGLGALVFILGARPAVVEAGAWVLPKGRTDIQVALLHQDTTDQYFLDGERIPYFFEGHNRTSALYIDARHGVTDRLEGVVQVPFFLLRFDDLSDDRRSSGLGDVRLGLRYNFVKSSPVATLDVRVKFPTGTFVNDAEVVPVGEGQWDLDLAAEVAHSFWPRPFYVNGLAGYRFRGPNEESGLDFGDELFWLLESGYEVNGRIGLKVVARGLHGKRGSSFGIPIDTLKREAVYLVPGLVIRASPTWAVELSVPFTVAGRNWPAGPVFSLKLTKAF